MRAMLLLALAAVVAGSAFESSFHEHKNVAEMVDYLKSTEENVANLFAHASQSALYKCPPLVPIPEQKVYLSGMEGQGDTSVTLMATLSTIKGLPATLESELAALGVIIKFGKILGAGVMGKVYQCKYLRGGWRGKVGLETTAAVKVQYLGQSRSEESGKKLASFFNEAKAMYNAGLAGLAPKLHRVGVFPIQGKNDQYVAIMVMDAIGEGYAHPNNIINEQKDAGDGKDKYHCRLDLLQGKKITADGYITKNQILALRDATDKLNKLCLVHWENDFHVDQVFMTRDRSPKVLFIDFGMASNVHLASTDLMIGQLLGLGAARRGQPILRTDDIIIGESEDDD